MHCIWTTHEGENTTNRSISNVFKFKHTTILSVRPNETPVPYIQRRSTTQSRRHCHGSGFEKHTHDVVTLWYGFLQTSAEAEHTQTDSSLNPVWPQSRVMNFRNRRNPSIKDRIQPYTAVYSRIRPYTAVYGCTQPYTAVYSRTRHGRI